MVLIQSDREPWEQELLTGLFEDRPVDQPAFVAATQRKFRIGKNLPVRS